MKHYKYLIIGGGMTADAAVQGIRSVEAASEIGVVGAESDSPYNRPPLSKALWKGESVDTIWRKTDRQNVTLHLGRTVTAIEPATKQVVDAHGDRYSWDKLLLATGGSPRRLPFGDDHIIYFRTLADYRRLREQTEKGKRFAVIGAGFIGSEIAAALALNQMKVVMLFPGKNIGERVFPHALSLFVSEFYKEKGVELLPGERVTGLDKRGDQLAVRTSGGQEIPVDGVAASTCPHTFHNSTPRTRPSFR